MVGEVKKWVEREFIHQWTRRLMSVFFDKDTKWASGNINTTSKLRIPKVIIIQNFSSEGGRSPGGNRSLHPEDWGKNTGLNPPSSQYYTNA